MQTNESQNVSLVFALVLGNSSTETGLDVQRSALLLLHRMIKDVESYPNRLIFSSSGVLYVQSVDEENSQFCRLCKQDTRLPPGYFPPSNFVKNKFLGKLFYLPSLSHLLLIPNFKLIRIVSKNPKFWSQKGILRTYYPKKYF